ncbi:LicD family protein [Enterococcus gallinarum]|uniref:LicD family protein n=1 Tax=Enterococcus gallinarum TaxID=1353 RepID=UPI0011DDC15F|nr:LicD family protein [Enterococcus gallinarum]MEB6053356.1 LicD family protein [Enterococcus gallinarum]TXT69152.1 LicD family protein [Enterococcus gallinarum]
MEGGLRKVQLAELAILDEIVRICEEYKIIYYISGGTYLGAVRHGGFIPWDDDADIAMPRSEFDKFISIAKTELKENFEIKTYQGDPEYPYYVPKVIDKSVKLLDKSGMYEKIVPAWVDIFPLDGLPKNEFLCSIHKFRLLCLRALYNLSNFDTLVKVNKKDRPFIEKILIFIGKNTNIFSFLDSRKRMDAITKCLKLYSEDKSEIYMNFMGSYKFKSILSKKEIYGNGASYSFEDRLLNGPENFDAYLTQIYGNYMEIPNIEDQNKHETLVIIDKE